MYNQDFVDLLEMAYGQGFLSIGGEKSIDDMFRGVDLENKKILDVGCGVGGAEFYLAKNFKCEIVGMDVEPLVIERANAKLNGMQLKGKIEFKRCSDLKDLAGQEFDVIFSREVLLHVKDKEDIFNKIYSLLKPGGIFITVDWMHESSHYSKQFAEFLHSDGLDISLVDSLTYQVALQTVGFKNIALTDITHQELDDTIEILRRLQEDISEEVIERFGQEHFYNYCIPSWEAQIASLKNGELLVYKVVAEKVVV